MIFTTDQLDNIIKSVFSFNKNLYVETYKNHTDPHMTAHVGYKIAFKSYSRDGMFNELKNGIEEFKRIVCPELEKLQEDNRRLNEVFSMLKIEQIKPEPVKEVEWNSYLYMNGRMP